MYDQQVFRALHNYVTNLKTIISRLRVKFMKDNEPCNIYTIHVFCASIRARLKILDKTIFKKYTLTLLRVYYICKRGYFQKYTVSM